MHTKDYLAQELRKAGLPAMAEKAETGWYHDYLSPLDMPATTLANDLAVAGTPEAMALRARHLAGEFDASIDDAEDCSLIDFEWARQRGYILPDNATGQLTRSSAATAPVVKSFVGSSRDDRCLEVWFADKVTDETRAWLLDAINEKALSVHQPQPARERSWTGPGHLEKSGYICDCVGAVIGQHDRSCSLIRK